MRAKLLTDEHLVERLEEWRFLELELGNPHIPYDSSEWSGEPRMWSYIRLQDEVEELLAECHRRGLDTIPPLDAAERRFVERWPYLA